jgi:O-antigen/teichoic acid export membrane protein
MARRGTHSILANTAYLTASSGTTRILRVIYLIVVARFMGPELYGMLSYGQSWYLTFLGVTTLGFAIVIPREIGRDRAKAPLTIASSLRLQVLAIFIVTPLCLLAGLLVAQTTQERYLLLLFALILPGRGLAHWAEHVFTGYEKAKYGFRLEAIARTLEVGCGIVAVILWKNLLILVLIQVVSWWLQGLLGWWIVMRMSTEDRVSPGRRDIVMMCRKILPAAIYIALVMWIMQGPIVLYRQIPDSEATLGQVALLLNTFGILAIVPNMLAYAALPVLSRSAEHVDSNSIRFVTELCRIAFVLGTVISLFFCAVGPWFIEIIFGPAYQLTGSLLGATLVLLIPLTIARVAAGVIWARNIGIFSLLAALLGAATMTLVFQDLVASVGPAGAILAAGCGISLWGLFSIAYFAWTGEISLFDAIVKPAAASSIAAVIYSSVVAYNLYLALAVAMCTFFLACILLGIFKISEIARIITLARNFQRQRD